MKKTNQALLVVTLVWLPACQSQQHEADAYGNFEATEINVSAEVAGRILYLDAEEGLPLDSGQVVGLVDTMPLHLQLEQLKANRQAIAAQSEPVVAQMDVYETRLAHLKSELARFQKLLASGAATQKQVDDLASQVEVTESQIKSIAAQHAPIISQVRAVDAQMASLRDKINRCRIVNPSAGTVLVKLAEPGELAAPGKALYRLARLDYLYLRAYASGAQLASFAIGDTVRVWIDKDRKTDQSLQGRITWVSSEAEFTPKIVQTKEERVDMVYAFKVRVENDGRLKIGMPGEVEFLKK